MIECSGVAIPSASAASVTLLEGYASDGTVVLVDAETIRTAALDDYIGDTILRQVANADLAVINKADLVDVPTLSALESWLSNTAPRTKTIVSEHSKVPAWYRAGPWRNADPKPTNGPCRWAFRQYRLALCLSA